MPLLSAMLSNLLVKWVLAKGRWVTIMVQGVGVIVASAVSVIAMNPWTVLAGRFLLGLFAGSGPFVASKYIEESCPINMKG